MEKKEEICNSCDKFLKEVKTCVLCACPSSYLWESEEAVCPLNKW